MENLALPIGIDDFKKLIDNGYYYVDKTGLIKELLDKKGEVNLFTRPRRFGKTLNLSMLRYFFEKNDDESNAYLFDGLKIMSAGEKYTRELGQYPVITLTLKSAKQPTWEMAYASMVDDIANEFKRHPEILECDDILEEDKEEFKRIRAGKAEQIEYAKALAFLSMCLEKCYKKNSIILIDEYDVPLETAYYGGFYDEMIGFIRSLFESALKTNPFLEFSVITGCIVSAVAEPFRISKESIFTGLNNLEVISILNENYDEHFGFVDMEVKDMLTFYNLEGKMNVLKEWYDGYQFGNTEVYNPWGVINFVKQLCANENAFPTAAWSNSSSNKIVRDLIECADDEVKDEIETLIAGGTIEKQVHEDITYEDIYASEDNLWNFLFFTGYLKKVSLRMEGVHQYITMAIPNNELLYIYENSVMGWFKDQVKVQNLTGLYEALLSGDAGTFAEELAIQLQKTISYMDGKEAFYHGFLLGILGNLKGYLVKSNREAGDGRYDICVRSHNVSKTPVIIELKVSESFKKMDDRAAEAVEQIKKMSYAADLEEEGYTEVLYCGIGFFRKQLRVKMVRQEF